MYPSPKKVKSTHDVSSYYASRTRAPAEPPRRLQSPLQYVDRDQDKRQPTSLGSQRMTSNPTTEFSGSYGGQSEASTQRWPSTLGPQEVTSSPTAEPSEPQGFQREPKGIHGELQDHLAMSPANSKAAMAARQKALQDKMPDVLAASLCLQGVLGIRDPDPRTYPSKRSHSVRSDRTDDDE